VAEDHKADATPFVVLPTVDSMIHAGRFTTLRAARELEMLAVALPATLLFRVQSENPDAVVIAAGEAFLARTTQRSALREMFSETPAVMLAAEASPAILRTAARMSIYSVLPMEATTRQLVAAISAAVAGLAVTLPRLTSGMEEAMRTPEDLTTREVEVLRLMARGYRNKQLAAQLKISEHTAKFHVSSVLAKLSARTRTEAVTIGMTRGLVAI
jgi:NarL family two-component system response regulator YdfI